MLDTVRTTLHWAITTPIGDGLWPIRVQKSIARRINTLLGEPLCSREMLEARRAGSAVSAAPAPVAPPASAPVAAAAPAPKPAPKPKAAPVMVYYEKDRNQRELERIREVLGAREVPYKLLDVTGDESTIAFVTRSAKCEEDDLPIVFVAGDVVGTFRDLVQFDVNGQLVKAVFGTSA
jgi:hypothetical protein